jgi:hypothetical protein
VIPVVAMPGSYVPSVEGSLRAARHGRVVDA